MGQLWLISKNPYIIPMPSWVFKNNIDVCIVIFLMSAISLLIVLISIIIYKFSSTSHWNQISL